MTIDFWSNVFFITISTCILIRAFHEWLSFEHPIMGRAVWFLLLPSYIVIIIAGVIELLLVTPHFILSLLRTVGLAIFTDTAILFGIFLLVVKNKYKYTNKNNAISNVKVHL